MDSENHVWTSERSGHHLARGACSLSELAEVTGADAPYATLIVNELEARGLVTRTRDPHDQRRKLVELTATGHTAADTARRIINRPPAPVYDLSKNGLRGLADVLRRLQDAQPSPERLP